MSGNIFTIIFFVLLAGLLFATAILYAQNNPTTVEENRHNRILALTNDAIFLAIIVLMTFVPNIGYLSVFGGVITFTANAPPPAPLMRYTSPIPPCPSKASTV